MEHKIYQINHCTEDNIVGFVDINKYQLRRDLLGREYYSPFEHHGWERFYKSWSLLIWDKKLTKLLFQISKWNVTPDR